MGNLLYLIAVELFIFCVIGFFAYNAGIIQVLLVIAVIIFLLKINRFNKVIK